MTGFLDISFPLSVGFGSTAGPERRTDIVVLGSGREERNSRWAHSRRRYNAGHGIRHLDDLHAVIAFFEECQGRLHAFRFRDPVDNKSCLPSKTASALDQSLGLGDGNRKVFQLVKNYGSDLNPYRRNITKPVADTVLIAVGGHAKTNGADFEVNAVTGEITFHKAAIPQTGEEITAGYKFDTPARFDSDTLTINFAAFHAGEIPSIPIIEILP